VAAAVKSTREKFAVTHAEEIAAARMEIMKLDARSSRLLDVASELQSLAPMPRKVDLLIPDRVVLDPEQQTLRVCYRIPLP
jgi:hypothetical protein